MPPVSHGREFPATRLPVQILASGERPESREAFCNRSELSPLLFRY
jgi:hypothetical protein